MTSASGARARIRAVLAAVLVCALALAAAGILILAVLTVLALAGAELSPSSQVALNVVLGQGVAFGLTAVIYLKIRRRGLRYLGLSVPSGRDLKWILGGYVLALVGALSAAGVWLALGYAPAVNQVAELGIVDPKVFLLLLPLSILLVGPGEELLFRGLVQGRLREAFGPGTAVVLAAALFAVAHVVALQGALPARLLTVTILFIPGLVLGLSYERTHNVLVPALIHGLYNATLFLLAYIGATAGALG